MARPERFPRARILEAARAIVVERGPGKLTVALLSARLGAPVGSIYHRYPSLDLLLADLWLSTVESFQPEFLRHLAIEDTLEAGLAAVAFACRWVGHHHQEAHLLLRHRRQDFMHGEWPEPYRSRAEHLRRRGAADIRAYCRRLYGNASAAHLRRVRFALQDLPLAAFRSAIEAGAKMPRDVEPLVKDTCRYILEREHISPVRRESRRR